jgi:hypothetical protein
MRESLIFPYMQGMEWTTQLYKRGGWALVSNAFTKLPLSSEQILHPEKYFNYERPVKVVLPDLAGLLNATNNNQHSAISIQQSPETAGASAATTRTGISSRRPNRTPGLPTANRPLPTVPWRRIYSDVNGEWSYYLILDQFLSAPAESKRAAAGWAGDRYALYEGPNGQAFLAQVAVWDTENDAREFFAAYVKRTELRYPGAKPVESSADERRAWDTSEGGVTIELRGLRVVILEGVPEGTDLSALLKALNPTSSKDD